MTTHDVGGKEERKKQEIKSEDRHPLAFMRLLTKLQVDVGRSFRRIYQGLWVLETGFWQVLDWVAVITISRHYGKRAVVCID
jgi:hypothetical protein